MLGFNPLYAAALAVLGGGPTDPIPMLALDFMGGTLDPRLNFSRASNATQFDSAGRLAWAPHNLVTNSIAAGGTLGVVGSGGAFPPGWYRSTAAGVSHEIVEIGSDYIDVRISGTNGTGSQVWPQISFMQTALSGMPGETYTVSVETQIIAGSMAGFAPSAGKLNLQYLNIGAYVGEAPPSVVSSGVATVLVASGTVSPGANAVRGSLNLTIGSGGAVDVTIRMRRPYLHRGSPGDQSYYPTSGAAYYGPRFDYDPETLAARGLLMEEQRTNLIIYSHAHQFGCTSANASYTNNVPDPRGFGYVVTSTANGTSGQHYTYGGSLGSVAVSTLYTVSAIVVSSTNDLIQLTPSSTWCDASNIYVNFQFSTGTVIGKGTGVISTFIEPLGGGAYRVALSFNSSATATVGAGCIFGHISAAADGRLPTNTLTNTIVAGAVQAEAGGFPTSYIPTYGNAATRAADLCWTMLGAAVQVPFSITGEAAVPKMPTSVYPSLAALNDGTGNNRVLVYSANTSTSMGLAARVETEGVLQANINTLANTPFFNAKSFAARIENNDARIVAQGSGSADVSCTIPTNLTRVQIGGSVTATDHAKWIRRISIHERAMSDAELTSLSA